MQHIIYSFFVDLISSFVGDRACYKLNFQELSKFIDSTNLESNVKEKWNWGVGNGRGGGGLGGLKPPYFQALNIEEKKMKLVYLNCPRHSYYSSLPHVIARSHKIS